MILAIGFVICGFFLLRAVEIYLQAKTSDPANATNAQTIAGVTLISCILLAAVFIAWLSYKTQDTPDVLPSPSVSQPSR